MASQAILANQRFVGGITLNITSGAELPSTVVDKQIFVITDQFVNKYYLDTNKPTEPVEGDIWVQIARSPDVVDVSRGNESIRFGLVSASRYNGSAWEYLKAYHGFYGYWCCFTDLLNEIPVSTSSADVIIRLKESSADIPYIVLQHNYNNSGRTLVMRKDLDSTKLAWHTASGAISFSASSMYTNLCSFVTNRFSTTMQELIATTPVQCVVSNSDGTLVDVDLQAFLLSATELGNTDTTYKTEGTAIPYFDSAAKRIAYLNGTAAIWQTRTPYSNANSVGVAANGNFNDYTKTTTYGPRICFTLPGDVPIVKNADDTYSIAEVEVGSGEPEIVNIDLSLATAETKHVLKGFTFYSHETQELQTGELTVSGNADFTFSYDGAYTDVTDATTNTRTITFTGSGTFIPDYDLAVTATLQGGGGGGGESATSGNVATGGNGGHGYHVSSEVVLEAGVPYEIVVGEGGKEATIESTTSGHGGDGGDTIAFELTASGGKGGRYGYAGSPGADGEGGEGVPLENGGEGGYAYSPSVGGTTNRAPTAGQPGVVQLQFTVDAGQSIFDATATPADVLAGKTFFSGANGISTLQEGTLAMSLTYVAKAASFRRDPVTISSVNIVPVSLVAVNSDGDNLWNGWLTASSGNSSSGTVQVVSGSSTGTWSYSAGSLTIDLGWTYSESTLITVRMFGYEP